MTSGRSPECWSAGLDGDLTTVGFEPSSHQEGREAQRARGRRAGKSGVGGGEAPMRTSARPWTGPSARVSATLSASPRRPRAPENPKPDGAWTQRRAARPPRQKAEPAAHGNAPATLADLATDRGPWDAQMKGALCVHEALTARDGQTQSRRGPPASEPCTRLTETLRSPHGGRHTASSPEGRASDMPPRPHPWRAPRGQSHRRAARSISCSWTSQPSSHSRGRGTPPEPRSPHADTGPPGKQLSESLTVLETRQRRRLQKPEL